MQYISEIAKLVNTGRCWAVVGAGASCELGMPSWPKLAQIIVDAVREECAEFDTETYVKLLEDRDYPKLFSIAETDLGGIERLCSLVESALVPLRQRGELYGHLAEWPFAGYLTTNYDGYLKAHLDRTGIAFTVLGNSEEDFRKIRADSRQIIVQLHGSTNDPSNIVLTSKQYADFRTSPDREYFRRKLEGLFTMHDVVILGYSLSDPDISLIIESARNYSSPDHPIYMIAADVSDREAQELYETKNVRVISYDNDLGDHEYLSRRILPIASKFIAPRVRGESPFTSEPLEPEEAAASLYVYSRGQLMDPASDAIDNALQALSLRALARLPGPITGGVVQLAAELPLPEVPAELAARLNGVVARLQAINLVNLGSDGSLELTTEGREEVANHEAEAELLRRQVSEQISLDFRDEFPGCDEEDSLQFSEAALRGLDRSS